MPRSPTRPIGFCHPTLSFEIVLHEARWPLLFRMFRRLRLAEVVSSTADSSASPLISERRDYFEESITGSGTLLAGVATACQSYGVR
jgi:hypothetical protein